VAQTRFKLTFLTRAFLAGGAADDVETSLRHKGVKPRRRLIGMDGDGLRIPSLRGVLRFWFRAKHGDPGGAGLAKLAALARREALVFGSTGTGQGLRIVPVAQDTWKAEKVTAKRGSAQAYLGYGPLNDVAADQEFSSHNQFAFRDAIPAGTAFTFLALGTDHAVRELEQCLLLLHLFGGLGGRSRRSWGSVAVEGRGIPVFAAGQSLDAYVEHALSLVWPDAADRPSGRAALPRFSAFFAGTQIRGFGIESGGPDEVMDAFYDRFKATRLYDRFKPKASPPTALADHGLEVLDADPAKVSISRAPLRLAFGLPYTVTLGRGTGNLRSIEYAGGYAGPGGRIQPVARRASPLFLKVLRDAGGKHHGLSLYLVSEFFGRLGVKIHAKHKTGSAPPPSRRAVDEFLAAPDWTTLHVP
jgi:CRISPR type III-B/RAMP module RAMP protein Cmr1